MECKGACDHQEKKLSFNNLAHIYTLRKWKKCEGRRKIINGGHKNEIWLKISGKLV